MPEKMLQSEAELCEIRTRLLEMGEKVELMIADSIRSLVERNSPLAQSVIAAHQEVKSLEREIDAKCLGLLALSCPAEQELRQVALALKIVIDLERISDQCSSIARDVLELNREEQLKPFFDLTLMAEAAKTSVTEALNAFLVGNATLAYTVLNGARFVDELNEQIQRVLLTFIMEDPATIGRALRLNSISKYLDRISDHATNIAEMVIAMAVGKKIRRSLV